MTYPVPITKTFCCPHCALMREYKHTKYQWHLCPDCKRKKLKKRMFELKDYKGL